MSIDLETMDNISRGDREECVISNKMIQIVKMVEEMYKVVYSRKHLTSAISPPLVLINVVRRMHLSYMRRTEFTVRSMDSIETLQ